MARVILFPVGGRDAREHYECSVEQARGLADLEKYIDSEGLNKIYYGENKKIALWGMTSTDRLERIYNLVDDYDLVLFVQDGSVISYGMVLMKIKSPVLSEELWGSSIWSNVLFLTDVEPSGIPMGSIIKILGYKANFVLQGTIRLDDKKSQLVLSSYPDMCAKLNAWKEDAKQIRRDNDNQENVFNPKIFISYSHADEAYKNKLKNHLAILLRCWSAGEIWDDRELVAGDDFNEQIFKQIEDSNIHILLISADYFASDYCMDEFKKIMDSGKIVIPIIVRACYWRKAFIQNGRAIITFPINNGNIFSSGDEDSEFTKIVAYLDEKITKRLQGNDV